MNDNKSNYINANNNNKDEACDIMMFGKSTKKTLDSQIGMYGNGLKS